MAPTTQLWTSDAMLAHRTPSGHPERAERLEALLAAFDDHAAAPWMDAVERREPGPVDEARVTAVHDAAVLERARTTEADGGGWLDPDTYVGEGSLDAALVATGACVQAATAVASGEADHAFAAVRPPGHHATPSQAMGFCLVDHVAVAARALLDDGLCDRVVIVDHDVHHGNGTQDAFYADPDVLYLSLHQWPLYPGTGRVEEVGTGKGEGYTVNLPAPPGLGDDGLLGLVDAVCVPVLEQFAPDLLIVSAGFDGHARDPLAGWALTSGAFPAVLERLASVQDRVVCSLEGGYDLQALARGVLGQLAWMAGGEVAFDDEVAGGRGPDDAGVQDLLARARDALGPYWDL